MTDRIQAVIEATDNASPKFRNVATAAGQMDTAVEKSARTAQNFSRAGAAVGAALGTLAGILGDAARANAEAEVSQTRLQTTIEATGVLYEEYAASIERAGEAAVQMGFDDEAAADAISSMTQATGDAESAINNLGLAMDIARARGISLADAAKIVTNAELGRYGVLARIGIVLDANATKEEALAELQARYAGQAEAYANTQLGLLDELSQRYENAMETVGGYTGELQTLLLLLPGLSAGFTAAAAAAGAFNTAILGGGGAMAAGRGLIGVLLGPVGLAAAFAATALMMEKFGERGDGKSTEEIWDDTAQGADHLRTVLGSLAESGAGDLLNLGEASGRTLQGMYADFERIDELTRIVNDSEGMDPAQLNAYKGELLDLMDTYGGVYGAIRDFAPAQSQVAQILANTGVGASAAHAELEKLVTQFDAGQLTASQFLTGLDMIAMNLGTYDLLATKAAARSEAVADGFGRVGEMATGTAGDIANVASVAALYAGQIERLSAELEQQFNLTRNAYNGTSDALAAGFRTAVGNTNAIAQQSQAVADWATNLIDAQGAYSELDKLVAEGRIGGESGVFDDPSQYAAAQRAYNSILADNEDIQRDILAIQAQQAPLIAQMVGHQQDYIQGIRQGSAEEQMRALAYMDSATAAQALQLAQGYLADQDVFGPMVEQAAALNPYLALILEDMGIISRGADGSITLTGADTAQSEIALLTEAIEQLTAAQWIATFDGNTEAAEAAYERVMGDAQAWDALVSTATINVQDNASNVLSNVSSLLNGLDGRSVTSYATVIREEIGGPGIFGQLGGVMKYASGGVVAEMGETGDELLRFPNGGVAMTRGRGHYTVPEGTYVTPAPATAAMGLGGLTLHVNVAGNVYGIDDLTVAVASTLAPAIIDVLDDLELVKPR